MGGSPYVAPTGGFEPLACRLGGGRSILLSYVGIRLLFIFTGGRSAGLAGFGPQGQRIKKLYVASLQEFLNILLSYVGV